MEAWRQRQILRGIAMEITAEFEDGSGLQQSGAQNQPAAARNLMPPFPGRGVYGTDPRRQGYAGYEILRKRENFITCRFAPLTAAVPFRKTRCTSGKGGQCKGTESRLAPTLDIWPNCGQQGTGATAPATPHGKKTKLPLDSRGPSHGSRDPTSPSGVPARRGAVVPSPCSAPC